MTTFPRPIGQPTWEQLAGDDDEEWDFDLEMFDTEDLCKYTRHSQHLIEGIQSLGDTQHADLQGPQTVQNLEADELWLNAAGLASVHAAALARLVAMSESERTLYNIQSHYGDNWQGPVNLDAHLYFHGDTWQEQVDLVTHLECKWRNIGESMQNRFKELGPWWEPG
jgi:hypothetical protein